MKKKIENIPKDTLRFPVCTIDVSLLDMEKLQELPEITLDEGQEIPLGMGIALTFSTLLDDRFKGIDNKVWHEIKLKFIEALAEANGVLSHGMQYMLTLEEKGGNRNGNRNLS